MVEETHTGFGFVIYHDAGGLAMLQMGIYWKNALFFLVTCRLGRELGQGQGLSMVTWKKVR